MNAHQRRKARRVLKGLAYRMRLKAKRADALG